MNRAAEEEAPGPRPSRAVAVCWMLAVACVGSTAVSAQPASIDRDSFGVERWGIDSGLPARFVRALELDDRGFLWIGTSAGLSRFDGHSFVTLDAANTPELPGSSVLALEGSPRDGIWVGLEQGGLRSLRQGRVELDPRVASLSESTVNTLLADGQDLWVGTDEGLFRLTSAGLERFGPPGLAESRVIVLDAGPEGEVWVRSGLNGLWRISGDAAHKVDALEGCFGLAMAVDASGRVFLTCQEGVRAWSPDGSAEWIDEGRAESLFVDHEGALWYGHRRGLVRRRDGEARIVRSESELGDWRIRAFLEDDVGNLWLGSYSGGLTRLRRSLVEPFGAPEGVPIAQTTGVLALPDGSVIAGTYNDGAVQWQPRTGRWRRFTSADGLPSDRVWTFGVDADRPGRIWVGTSRGLAVLDGSSVERAAPVGLPYDDAVYVVYVDPRQENTLWTAGWSGPAIEVRGESRRVHDARNGLEADRVRFFHRDRDGRLLAGGEGGLFFLDGERWRRVSPFGPGGLFRALHEEPDGTIWLASDAAGLLRLSNGSAVSYGRRDGLPMAHIQSISADARGGIWLSGDEGVFRLESSDYESWAKGALDAIPFARLSERDGLRDPECNGWGSPTSTRLEGGQLVYPTRFGIAVVDAASFPAGELEPKEIVVDAVRAGGRLQTPRALVRLDKRARTLRIRFTAAELARSNPIDFRYRLEGVNDEWIAAGNSREADYSQVPPGRFRFRVQARLPGQEWVEAETPVEVVAEPLLLEATWFRLLAVSTALALVFAAYRWRTRIRRRHAAALERERGFLREVIDVSPNPIFVKGPDREYKLANRAAASLYGLTPAQLEGSAGAELRGSLPGMDRIEALDGELLAKRKEYTAVEELVVDGLGRARWYRVVKRPLVAPDGAVEHLIGTAVDVTAYKEAEKRLRARETDLMESQEEARRLSLRVLRAQEEERRRLGREIHDDLTQQLAGLAMLAGVLSRSRNGSGDGREMETEADGLESLRLELERLAEESQNLSRELHPTLLERAGLETALRSEGETFRRNAGLIVDVDCGDVAGELEPELSLALFRIVQEALRNTVKHARASEVLVSLARTGNGIELVVEDDGDGFDVEAARTAPGVGLASMTERARLVGGRLQIESAPGRGTRIVVRVPAATVEAGLSQESPPKSPDEPPADPS